MVRKCVEKDRKRIKAFLNEKPVYHTFLISDLDRYGFDKEFQTIYIQEEEGQCIGVFLKYFNNLILAGEGGTLDYEAIGRLADHEITTIMGKAETVKNVAKCVGRETQITYNNLYIHKKTEEEVSDARGVRFASLGDVDNIYQFLMSFPEMKTLYSEKKMLKNRISSGEGIHAVIEKEGQIVAHGNSAASAELTCMLGGICVKEEYRGNDYAKEIIKTLYDEIHKQGKIPCIFAPEDNVYSIFSQLGFEIYGKWGVARLI